MSYDPVSGAGHKVSPGAAFEREMIAEHVCSLDHRPLHWTASGGDADLGVRDSASKQLDPTAPLGRYRSERLGRHMAAGRVGKELTVPLTERAIAVLKGLPSRGIGHLPVFPSRRNPGVLAIGGCRWVVRGG